MSVSSSGHELELNTSIRANDTTARYIKQAVTLTGLGSVEFDKSVAGIYSVAEFLGRQLVEGDLNDWVPTHVESHVGVQAGNRYFQWKNSPNAGEAVEFQPMVDPRGVLARMAGENFVHTIDNEVEYRDCIVGEQGSNQ